MFECVDFDLIVLVVVAIGVDEDFEVIIFENDGIVLRQRAPDVGFLEQGADVEVGVVPEHAGTSLKPWDRAGRAQDVDEGISPGSATPSVVVKSAVDLNRERGLDRPRSVWAGLPGRVSSGLVSGVRLCAIRRRFEDLGQEVGLCWDLARFRGSAGRRNIRVRECENLRPR